MNLTRWMLVILLGLWGTSCATPQPEVTTGIEDVQTVRFLPDLAEARRRSRASGRPVVLIFGAIWCSSCQQFRRNTIPAAEVLALESDFEWVFVNVDREHSLARSYGVRGTPQFFVLDPDGEIVAEAIGNLAPAEFRTFLEDAAELAVQPAREETVERSVLAAEDLTALTWTPRGYRGDSICFSHVGYGPLDIPSQSPASVLRLALQPRTPSTLGKGQKEIRWTETLTNFFAFEQDRYRLDYGALFSTVSMAYGISDTLQVELELIDFRRFDSVLDGVTDTFHDLFGLDDGGRDDFPSRENVIQAGGVNSIDEATYAEDVAFTVQHNITCGTEKWPALAYSITARTNFAGNIPVNGSPNLSLGASLSASRRFGNRWYAYASLGHVWHGLDEWRGLSLVDQQFSALFAGEWRYRPDCAWVVQYLISEAVSDEIAPFNDPTHEFNLGWKKEVARGTVLELGVIENAFIVDNSPDVGFHFGLTHRF